MRRLIRQRKRGSLLLLRQGGPFLRNCPRKAAGLPRSAPFVKDKGGCKDEARWRDQPPTQQEWGRGRYQEERGQPPPPPKGNRREPWREEPGRDRGPRREQRGGATQALEEEEGGDAAPEMNVLCREDSDEEEGIFGL